MFTSTVTSALALAGAVSASTTPFKYPLANGFPQFTSMAQLVAVEKQAGGPLPQGAGPSTLTDLEATTLQAIAFEEFFEVAFFTEVLQNVTQGAPGFYNIDNYASVVQQLTATQAQEQLHALSSNGGLKAAGRPIVAPCEYILPVSSWEDALDIMDDFTSSVLAALPSLQSTLVQDGSDTAADLAKTFSVISGQEGQQDGFYRSLRGGAASANAFLTTSSPEYLYNHIVQNFVVPGSCKTPINITLFEPLTVIGSPAQPQNGTLGFATPQTGVTEGEFYISYLSGQVYPITVPITNVNSTGNVTTFEAAFPFDLGMSKGLTIASLVNSKGNWTTSDEVVAATVAGPGFVQVL